MADQINSFESTHVHDQPSISDPTKRSGRRSFLRGLGLGAAGAAFGATGLSATNALSAQPNLDVAILEFALNLEYLEAEFYLRATTGQGLSPADIGPNPGQVTGGQKVNFSSPINQAYANEIAAEEQKHVRNFGTRVNGIGLCLSRDFPPLCCPP
jgi:Ferritin-like domain